MRNKKQMLVLAFLVAFLFSIRCSKSLETSGNENLSQANSKPESLNANKKSLVDDGKQIFRYDAFGDEDFWSGLLHIDKAIKGARRGGFGPGVSPKTALAVGLKVDADALPPDVVAGIKSGAINLDNPATTIALLKLNAVVGVKGNFNAKGNLQSNWYYLRFLSFYGR
jgi:hypothetical protein